MESMIAQEFRTQSESIGKITTALVAFQAQAKGVRKTAENPFFHSKYAELGDVWDEIREPLTKNGLAVVQSFMGDSLVTTLAHTSGEWFRGYLRLTPIKANDPQAQGSAITYVRRYALQAITGIASVDDDGNAAAHGSRDAETPAKSNPPAAEAASKAFANVITESFSVSEPIESKNKKGTYYRKAIDSKQQSYYVHKDAVIADLSVSNGNPITVRLERQGNFTSIVEVLGA